MNAPRPKAPAHDEKTRALRGRLASAQQTLFEKFSDRIARVEGWRPIFAGFGVIGALLVAVARAFTGDLGLGLTIAGAVMAAAGGALVVLMDFKKLEIAQDAKNVMQVADDTLAALEARDTEIGLVRDAAATSAAQATAFDAKRLARIEAIRLMIESIEAALLSDADVVTSAQRLLAAAAANLRRAVDYGGGDFLTFTIFQRQAVAGEERMQPIAREWTDRARADAGGRHWTRGYGYTGVLWILAEANHTASVVERDTALPGVREKYRVSDPIADQESRYRSIASFPILVGKTNVVWGVVTATSDRTDVFDHEGDLARQSVETVRDVALAAGLLVKMREGVHRPA